MTPSVADQVAEITGCRNIDDHFCETHGNDWPCKVDPVLRLIHLTQSGAMAAFAELLEGKGEARAAVMADREATFYRRWAESPETLPLMSDTQTCEHCGDGVYTLSSRDWCDGCEAWYCAATDGEL